MSDFIDELNLSEEVSRKLRGFGAPNSVALLSLLHAAPDAAESYLGSDSFKLASDQLSATLSAADLAALNSAAPKFFLGARIDRSAPTVLPPRYDVVERDVLLHRINELRSKGKFGSALSDADKLELEKLESQIDTMLRA